MIYSKKDIIAVVVSFNPTKVLEKNVRSLISQVDLVCIIDNNSKEGREVLSKIEKEEGCVVVYHENNEGVSKRLNEGVSIALQRNYKLMLSMDQDTVLSYDCVKNMTSVINSDPHIVSVGPHRVKRHMNKEYYYKDYLITSGNLVKVDSIVSSGGYWTDLFVDLVDIDISLALRKNGNKLVIANRAQMEHEVGNKEERIILGRKVAYYSHSVKRYYFIFRNFVLIEKTYFRSFPLFCLKLALSHILILVHIVLEKEKKLKLKEVIHGMVDSRQIAKRPEELFCGG